MTAELFESVTYSEGNAKWYALRRALGDIFDAELVSAIHWDTDTQALSFQGYVNSINVWLGDDDGRPGTIVEYNNHPAGADPQTLWEAP